MASTPISSKMRGDVISLLLIWWCLVPLDAAKCSPERCGSMNVSYPFWIQNPSCGYPGFQIKCKAEANLSGDSVPFLPTPGGDGPDSYSQIMHINYTGYLIINSTSRKAMSCHQTDDAFVVFSLPNDGPFTISSVNRFAVIGCDSSGSFVDNEARGGSCKSACLNQYDPQYCNYYGCCEAGIPGHWKWINFTGGGSAYEAFPGVCGFSTILDPSTYTIPHNERGIFARGRYGLRLDWGVGHLNCSMTKGTFNDSCAKEARCSDSQTGQGHVCACRPGFEGTGYSNGTGCTDIDECRGKNQCVERPAGSCYNLPGIYNCSCSKGYVGDGFRNSSGCKSASSNKAVIPATIGSVSSFIGVSLAATVLFWWLKKRHEKVVKAKYFQQNGGVQLQQYIASRGGRENLKIYSATELEKASKNYSSDMKLGSGGYGTVFKGILLDGSDVAIKRSREISDPQEDDQFINELIILSQINHRNVVKLRGCCLETQFPLLVYEFVPNGTLFEHLHSGEESLDWESRLRVAIETAEALAYLHSAASQPIYHRDVKSSNILLDKTFTPKVADFGISRLLSADDTHLTTDVMGTMGYMDPEYFRSFQLTDKSDVYSFGVVLLELLTGLAPLSLERPKDECTLSALFLFKFADNRLSEILDNNVVNEENRVQMEKMASLARECLQVEGKRRPSMKEVVEELVWIRGSSKHERSYSNPSDEKYRGRDGKQTSMARADSIGTSQNKNIERNYTYPVTGESITFEPSSIALVRMSTMDPR